MNIHYDNSGVPALPKPCNNCGPSVPFEVEFASIQTNGNAPYDVLRCSRCGLRWVNGNPQLEWYSGESQHSPCSAPEIIRRQKVLNAAERMSGLRTYCARRGRLLDIGCGTGEFVHAALTDGYHAEGLEPNPAEVDYARKRYGVQVNQGTLEDNLYAPGNFDVVTMYGVIEHLADPRGVLEIATKLLRPAGMLIVQTPTEDALFRRVSRVMWKLSGHRTSVVVNQFYMAALHYFGYSRRSLSTLMAGLGLETVAVRPSSFGIRILFQRFSAWPWYRRWPAVFATALLGGTERLLGGGNHIIVYARKRDLSG